MYYFWTVFGVIKPTAVPDVKDHGCALMLLGPNLGISSTHEALLNKDADIADSRNHSGYIRR